MVIGFFETPAGVAYYIDFKFPKLRGNRRRVVVPGISSMTLLYITYRKRKLWVFQENGKLVFDLFVSLIAGSLA